MKIFPNLLARPRLNDGVLLALPVLDQLVFSSANFLVSIILAGALTLEDFGRFSALYALVAFGASMHTATISEPISVRRAVEKPRSERLAEALWLSSIFSTILLAASLVGLEILSSTSDTSLLLGTIVCALALPFFWTLRQLALVNAQPTHSAVGTCIYAISLLGIVGCFGLFGNVTPTTPLVAMGVSSLLAFSAILFLQKTLPTRLDRKSTVSLLAEVGRYSAWSLPANMVAWASMNIFFIVLPLLGDLKGAASFRMFSNLIFPLQQVLVGLSSGLLPRLSRSFARSNGGASKTTLFLLVFVSIGTVIYSVALVTLGEFLLNNVYGSKFQSFQQVAVWGMAIPVLLGIAACIRLTLRAQNQPRAVFLGYLWGASLGGMVAVPFGIFAGEVGAVLGTTSIQFCIALFLIFFWRRSSKPLRNF